MKKSKGAGTIIFVVDDPLSPLSKGAAHRDIYTVIKIFKTENLVFVDKPV